MITDVTKFKFEHLIIKLTSRRLWAWAVTTILVSKILFMKYDDFKYVQTVVICWCICTVCYMLSHSLEELLKILANRTNIDVKLGNR